MNAGNINNTVEYMESNVFARKRGDSEFISHCLEHKGCLGRPKVPNNKLMLSRKVRYRKEELGALV